MFVKNRENLGRTRKEKDHYIAQHPDAPRYTPHSFTEKSANMFFVSFEQPAEIRIL